MSRDVSALLRLRVPVIVRLAQRRLSLQGVLAIGPGAIIELPKHADDPLELMVNNKVIGQGYAVKVGENFGLRIDQIGDARQRVAAMAGRRHPSTRPSADAPTDNAPSADNAAESVSDDATPTVEDVASA